MRRLWILVVMCFWAVLFTFGCAVTTGQKFHHENSICIWKGGAINKWWFIFSLLLFFPPVTSLHPLSGLTWTIITILRNASWGEHTGEKLGLWITHLHFPPRGIQTFILWSHPSFRDSNNEPLLHCIAILAILANKLAAVSFKTTAKQVNIDILLFPPTFLNFPRSQYNVDTMTAVRIKHEDHDDCDVTWSPGSSDDHPPTDRKSLGSNWWADHQRRHGQGAPGAQEILRGRPLLGTLESSHTTVLG